VEPEWGGPPRVHGPRGGGRSRVQQPDRRLRGMPRAPRGRSRSGGGLASRREEAMTRPDIDAILGDLGRVIKAVDPDETRRFRRAILEADRIYPPAPAPSRPTP